MLYGRRRGVVRWRSMTPEQEARVNIDRLLEQAGWSVQNSDSINLYMLSSGVAVREFPLKSGHGAADYLLYVNQKAAGVVEAKPEGVHPYRRRSPVREVQHWPARQPSRPPAASPFPVREHRRGDAVHQQARPGAAKPSGLLLSIPLETLAKWIGSSETPGTAPQGVSEASE